MTKKDWEYAAKDRFLSYLRRANGEEWEVLGEDCPAEGSCPRDFDFRLGLGERRMALELFRLTDSGASLAAQYTWIEIVTLIEKEFESRGIVDLSMSTPPYFSVPKAQRARFVKATCDELEPYVRGLGDGEEVKVKGFCIAKIQGLGTNMSSRCYGFGTFNPVGKAYGPLCRLLPEKNAQLEVVGHDRVVLIVSWAHIITTGDLLEALKDIDLEPLRNIDRIYFEPAMDQIDLVFDRTVGSVLNGLPLAN